MKQLVFSAVGILMVASLTACGSESSNLPSEAVGVGGSDDGTGGGSSTGGNHSEGSGGDVSMSAGGAAGDSGGQGAGGGEASGGQKGSGGGEASGGHTGSGGGASVTLPAFVSSAPGDYFNIQGQVTEVTTAAALTVDTTSKLQRWDGFGGTFNEMGWDALSVVSSEIDRAMTLLFDAQDGANFIFGRIPLGASDYSMSWYTLAETANDYAMDHFSIARDREMLIPFIKAAQEIQPGLRFFASPWVVPDWMMDGSNNMKIDAPTLGAHALYFAKFAQEYEKEGIVIEAIHTQNEPGYARVHWTQALFIDFIKSYLGPKFTELNVSSEIWCGTMSHPDDGTIATTLANDAAAMKYVKGFGLQWNLQSTVATLAPKGPVMQTEHKCGNYNFSTPYWDQSRYDANKAQNDHLYAEESWQLIRDWITAGVNSYVAWNMVLDTVGKSLDGWPQNALLVVDRSAKTLTPTPAYYVFRHFSQYINPGATRLALTGSKDALAFMNLDNSIIIEVYNSTTASKTTSVNVGTTTYQFDVPAHGWATVRVAP